MPEKLTRLYDLNKNITVLNLPREEFSNYSDKDSLTESKLLKLLTKDTVFGVCKINKMLSNSLLLSKEVIFYLLDVPVASAGIQREYREIFKTLVHREFSCREYTSIFITGLLTGRTEINDIDDAWEYRDEIYVPKINIEEYSEFFDPVHILKKMAKIIIFLRRQVRIYFREIEAYKNGIHDISYEIATMCSKNKFKEIGQKQLVTHSVNLLFNLSGVLFPETLDKYTRNENHVEYGYTTKIHKELFREEVGRYTYSKRRENDVVDFHTNYTFIEMVSSRPQILHHIEELLSEVYFINKSRNLVIPKPVNSDVSERIRRKAMFYAMNEMVRFEKHRAITCNPKYKLDTISIISAMRSGKKFQSIPRRRKILFYLENASEFVNGGEEENIKDISPSKELYEKINNYIDNRCSNWDVITRNVYGKMYCMLHTEIHSSLRNMYYLKSMKIQISKVALLRMLMLCVDGYDLNNPSLKKFIFNNRVGVVRKWIANIFDIEKIPDIVWDCFIFTMETLFAHSHIRADEIKWYTDNVHSFWKLVDGKDLNGKEAMTVLIFSSADKFNLEFYAFIKMNNKLQDEITTDIIEKYWDKFWAQTFINYGKFCLLDTDKYYRGYLFNHDSELKDVIGNIDTFVTENVHDIFMNQFIKLVNA